MQPALRDSPRVYPDKPAGSICLMSYIRYHCWTDCTQAPVLQSRPCPPTPLPRPPRPKPPFGHAGLQPAVPADQGLILRSLQAGEWKPGEAIPSEMELAARFRVSQGTVRKAIDELAAENLRGAPPGQGHLRRHACRAARPVPLPAARARQRRARGPARAASSTAGACAPAPSGARAELRTGDAVVQVRRVLCFGGRPPCWTTSGCPAARSRA
jgi:GntR family transcriptional regulator